MKIKVQPDQKLPGKRSVYKDKHTINYIALQCERNLQKSFFLEMAFISQYESSFSNFNFYCFIYSPFIQIKNVALALPHFILKIKLPPFRRLLFYVIGHPWVWVTVEHFRLHLLLIASCLICSCCAVTMATSLCYIF